MAAKKAEDPYYALYRTLAEKLTRNGVEPSVTQVHNMAEKYVVMGYHFEVLMTAINKHDTLKFKWEDLMLLLKLTEGHDEDE